MDLVEATRKAREKNTQLLNDQGFATLALAISNIFAQVAENPDKIIFGRPKGSTFRFLPRMPLT
ncbi:hypothetical protein H8E77_42615 [bacterium]|nr:hypothetical protein [bacterium]